MPVFCKARTVPYAIREPVEHELGNLQKEGVLVPVTRSDWATSVWIPVQNRMAQPGSTPSQSDSDTASPPDGPAPEQRLPPPNRASVTELPSQQAPDASFQENVAPPEL
ncbi:hypothetical protein MRX96_010278 [Rhipicephalus microplus]